MNHNIRSRKRLLGAILTIGLVFGVAACSEDTPKKDSAQGSDQRTTEEYYKALRSAVPYPLAEMKDSMERRNLREKLLRFNDSSKIGYVYLLGVDGNVISFFTVKGKVSSTQSQMTADNTVEWRSGNGGEDAASITNAPGDDGSYGQNEDGIFFFTTEGVYVTWNGPYIYLDAPLKIEADAVPLTLPEDAEPTSVADEKTFGGEN